MKKAAVVAVVCFASLISPQASAQLLGSLVVNMTSPASGSTVSGTAPVSASVTIIGAITVAGVQFKLDGANLGGEDTSAPYSVSWNTAGVANGTHTLSAVARAGLLGLTFTSNSVTVTVNNAPPPDTTPPSASLSAPANGATVSGTVAVSASASDNVGVTGVQFKLDGANLGAEDTAAPYSVSWNTATAANGTHTLTATARDAAGNRTTSAAVTVTVNNAPPPDTTPPSVSLTAPASGATVSGTVAVSASASDNVGVAGVQFQLDGANLAAEDTAAPYSVSWNTTSVANGAHTLRATARDAAGNRTTSVAITVTVNNAPPPDTTPPTVSITAPANGATVSGTVTLSANAADNVGVAGVQFFGDGMLLGDDTTAPYSISVDTTASSNGPHTLTAVARDAAGNQTTSAAVTVTVSNGPPPDTTPPTVSITAPANGATVSGTVTVTANATDNVGVAGVQFLRDGVTFGAEDTSAPYSIAFDTTASSNGQHTLSAVARDAAGNRTTSASVTVTVANAAATKRFEETDPSITYSSGWASDSQGGLSGGTAAFTNGAGAQATFTFTGTSVSWIGGRSFETGIAQVILDGSLVSTIDTYSKTVEVQVPIFTATGLANGSHTLTIQATGQQNAAAASAFIILDAFDVPAATISRLQDTDPAVSYTGTGWAHGITNDRWSGGSASASVTAGDQATFTFTGTGVRWLGARGAQHGIARVSLDGAFVTQVDSFQAPTDPNHQVQVQAELFKATGLANGTHTLTIQVTGQQNPASTGAIVVVDAFDVITPGTRHEDTDPAISYSGAWALGNIDHPYSEGSGALSTAAGDQATFSFTGTSVSWIGWLGPQGGMARVFVDGALANGNVDTFVPTPTEGTQNVIFTASGLTPGAHTITILATGTGNPASTGTGVVVDAFDVTP
jgi:hypothetical protein